MTMPLLDAQGASSLVGVTSVEEAVRAQAAGSDALLIKREMLAHAEREGAVVKLMQELRYAMSGDD
jgi:hypothetical protein